MTLEEFKAITEESYRRTHVRYKGFLGGLYWGNPDELDWYWEFEKDGAVDYDSKKFTSWDKLLLSDCFWGHRLPEIVEDLVIDG